MMPGDGIGPEMMGYVKDVFRVAGAPIDFEVAALNPSNDSYEDLVNVWKLHNWNLVWAKPITLFLCRLFPPWRETGAVWKVTLRPRWTGLTSSPETWRCVTSWICLSTCWNASLNQGLKPDMITWTLCWFVKTRRASTQCWNTRVCQGSLKAWRLSPRKARSGFADLPSTMPRPTGGRRLP